MKGAQLTEAAAAENILTGPWSRPLPQPQRSEGGEIRLTLAAHDGITRIYTNQPMFQTLVEQDLRLAINDGLDTLVFRGLQLSTRETRLLIAAGTGAGFAAAYNTPFAAVLFVLEIVTGVVGIDILVPVAIATAVATALTRVAIGGGPLYGQRQFALVAQTEILAYCALGVLAGLLGPLFLAALSNAAGVS